MSQLPKGTRRAFLKAGAVTAVGVGTLSGGATAAVNGWSEVDSPTGQTLYDAVMTTEGPYAVGAGGVVLARRADGWQPVLERGPTVQSNPLRGADVTDDGRNVWFCGGSGVIGQYDVVDEQLTDYSAPMGKTSTWLNLAVVGTAGSETVYLVNGSGEFLSGTKTPDGGMDWGEVFKPGGGSSAPGIDFYSETEGYVTDTNSKVYRTTDGGETWTDVGIPGAGVGLFDVGALNEGDLDVAGAGGKIFRLNDGDGKGWKRKNVGSNTVLSLVRAGAAGLAAGTGGFVYDRRKNKWTKTETPTTSTLRGVALDATDSYPDVSVGDGGSIIERGEFAASLPNSISITTSSSDTTEYRFTVDGAVRETGTVESDDTVQNSVLSDDVVTGSVGGSDDDDSYTFSGEITDFEVTSGSTQNITISVDGTAKTVAELADEPWIEVESPTGQTLYSAVQTQEGPYAVGAGGDVLARRADGWEQVLDAGPTTESNTLRDAAVTDDGRNVWFAGGSGVVGQYDVTDEQLTDYSAPKEKTSTWEGIAVTGDAGAETVHLVNGSGEVLRGTKNSEGGMDWGTAFKPGGGSSMKAIDFLDSQTGYICDTNAKVYETTDGGRSYTDIGISGGSVGLYGITATARDDIVVAAGDGTLFRYNGAVWTKLYAGGNALFGVDRFAETGLVAGNGGTVYELTQDGWEPDETPTTATLQGVVLDGTGTYPDVAVGASGTIIERGEYTAPPSDDEETFADWTTAESPTGQTLYGVVQSQEGPYAVGGGGDVLARRADGWVRVLDTGPTTESNTLRDAAVTDDGRNVWFAGGSGVVGQYDVADEQLTDYSAPNGKTSTWEGVAVTGNADTETVHLVNGSGEVLRGTKNSEGGMDWGEAFKPGGGSSMKGIDFLDSQTGYICDTNAKVYETTDGWRSYSTLGISGGSVGLYDVTATARDDIVVAGGDGSLFRYNGAVWTKNEAGSRALFGVDRFEEAGAAAGAGGAMYVLTGEGWEPEETPTTAILQGVALDETGSYPDVAVGANGTIIERGEYTAPPSEDDPSFAGWTEATSPTGQSLNAVVEGADGPYAVGGGGRVVTRRDGSWQLVVEKGPTGEENTLTGAGVTDDGARVWFCGGSGAIGQYDVTDGTLTDYSAPLGKTSTWEAMAVAGPAGSERVLLVNGSGEALAGEKASDGSMNWGEVVKPGGGSSAKDVTFLDSQTGYVCDTNAKVYETTDGGENYTTIGIDGGSVGLYGVAAAARDDLSVAGGDGSVLQYNGAVWTKLSVSAGALYTIDRVGSDGLVAGGGGRIFARTDEGWQQTETPVTERLDGVAFVSDGPDVAVGANGTILERDD
ncbi:hypothetical protein AUR64_00600 [Haloprofundus marisrubri]|uniref:Photosynthesis system II assembly factor Ycf48/Hcf136-like domain-containing protein n=1 Tax=Haloprofundus marisrubri TaxID=1514971 RepID=A0A0W1R430_9EURY|nr:hypothetical protein [Haloprofundus marisrubri]KTG08111.1 hypothetical protein AUR64_00600 [Haloprofundus marisrubri]